MGIHNTQISNENLVSVYNNQIVPIRRLKIIGDKYAIDIVGSVNSGANGLVTFAEALERLNNAKRVIDRQWDLYHKYQENITDEEAFIIKDLQTLMTRANQSLENVRRYLRTGDMIGLTLYSMDDLGNLINPISGKISSLIDVKLDRTKSLYEESMESYENQRLLALTVIVMGIVLSVLVCMTLIRTISLSLSRVTLKLQDLARGEGDLTKRIPVVSKDEVGHLATHFNHVLDKLSKLVKEIQKSGATLTHSAEKMRLSSKKLGYTVHGFGSFTSEVVTNTKQISSTSQDLLTTIQEVSSTATSTANIAGSGQERLSEMQMSMEKMEEASKSIAVRLGVINDKAENISNVLVAIFKVAERINLLSFNASIEAEKAGQYGLGFSVVAREIRRLADQTTIATTDIGKIVQEMKEAVMVGVEEVDNFSEEVKVYVENLRNITGKLAQIIHEVQNLKPQFERVHLGMQRQASRAQDIEMSASQLNESAMVANKSMQESETNIVLVKNSAVDLQSEVGRFKV